MIRTLIAVCLIILNSGRLLAWNKQQTLYIHAILELEINSMPGVGNKECPCCLEKLLLLYHSAILVPSLQIALREYICAALRCNGGSSVDCSRVNRESVELKTLLEASIPQSWLRMTLNRLINLKKAIADKL